MPMAKARWPGAAAPMSVGFIPSRAAASRIGPTPKAKVRTP